jgi:spore maturation protein CgeB
LHFANNIPRVLLVGPYWLGGWTDSTYGAFLQHHCEVKCIYYNNPATDAVSKKIKSRFQIKSWPYFIKHTGYFFRGINFGKELYKMAYEFQPDLILVLKGEIILPGTLRKLKELDSKPGIATWWVDNPIISGEGHRWLTFPRCVPHYDKIFIFDYSYIEQLKKLGAKELIFLPCAADPDIYHPEALTSQQLEQFKSSICFVWSFYPSRAELLRPFLDIPDIGIWGGGWEQYLRQNGKNDLSHIVRGVSLKPEDVSRAYQAASVVINSHHSQTKKAGLNTRSFEILASGGLELVDYVPGMEDLLVPGEEVIVYRDPHEGAQLARSAMENPDRFIEIKRKGYERVLKEHTYYHRVRKILSSFSMI